MKTFMALLCTACALPASASAAPIVWHLVNVAFADGATAIGSFAYDADDKTYTDIDIVTQPGDGFPGESYGTVFSGYGGSLLAPNVQDYTGRSLLLLLPAYPLDNSGGEFPVQTVEFLCGDETCNSSTASRSTIKGYISSLPTSTAVPEPATWILLIAGFGGIGSVLRRRTSSVLACRPARSDAARTSAKRRRSRRKSQIGA